MRSLERKNEFVEVQVHHSEECPVREKSHGLEVPLDTHNQILVSCPCPSADPRLTVIMPRKR